MLLSVTPDLPTLNGILFCPVIRWFLSYLRGQRAGEQVAQDRVLPPIHS